MESKLRGFGMLYLDRRTEQTITLYTDAGLRIVISVERVWGRTVKLGIDAPLSVHVDRTEIYRRKQADKVMP